MNEIIDLLKNSQLFSSLKPDELEIIAKNSELKDFMDDQVIFSTGSMGESLYIIKKGGVRITKETQDNKVMDIAKFIPGELFGELDLFEEVPRPANAIAEEETTLLIFPRSGLKFNDIIDRHPDIFAHILDDLIAMIAHRIRETNKLVSERTKWIEELRQQILYDKLTGMYNKSYISEEFPSQLAHFAEGASILYVKPDNFKHINDTFGHTAGDGALLLLAQTVKSHLGEADIGVRYRGNEFVAILPNTTGDDALKRADAIRQSIYDMDLKHLTNGQDFRLTGCVGVALYPDHSKDSTVLIEKAFNMMLHLQKTGGNNAGFAPN
ncbi:MAG: GGDEF domain-containing protein [Spirochaetales bacterium]|nr:GGDEF domain-containing protein [Spirochaetales bacterium]